MRILLFLFLITTQVFAASGQTQLKPRSKLDIQIEEIAGAQRSQRLVAGTLFALTGTVTSFAGFACLALCNQQNRDAKLPLAIGVTLVSFTTATLLFGVRSDEENLARHYFGSWQKLPEAERTQKAEARFGELNREARIRRQWQSALITIFGVSQYALSTTRKRESESAWLMYSGLAFTGTGILGFFMKSPTERAWFDYQLSPVVFQSGTAGVGLSVSL